MSFDEEEVMSDNEEEDEVMSNDKEEIMMNNNDDDDDDEEEVMSTDDDDDNFVEQEITTPAWSETFAQPVSGYRPKGRIEELRGGESATLLRPMPTYVVGDSESRICMLIFSDEYGIESGRHKLVADEFASQYNYFVVLPDVFRGSPPMTENSTTPEQGMEQIVSHFTYSHLKPDLLQTVIPYCKGGLGKHARTIVCLGFSYGAYLWTCLGAEPHVRLAACAAPSALIVEVCAATKEHYKHALAKFRCPILLLNAVGDSDEQKVEGLIQRIMYGLNGIPASMFLTQMDVRPGWSMRGDTTNGIVREATQAVYEHVQRFFEKHTTGIRTTMAPK